MSEVSPEERVMMLEKTITFMNSGGKKMRKEINELKQENETLRSANEDLIKENRTLKNFKKVDVEHPSNKFF